MIDQLRLEGVGGGALWITQLVDGHRTVLVDTHQQPVQPHHWTCCHPLLDIADQTRGIGEARDASVEEGGVVCGHGGAGLADEDSAHSTLADMYTCCHILRDFRFRGSEMLPPSHPLVCGSGSLYYTSWPRRQ